MLRRGVLLALVGCWMWNSSAMAEETYFRVRLTEMEFSDGELPHYRGQQPEPQVRQRVAQTPPDVQLDEPGEAYLQRGDLWSSVWDWTQPDRVAPVHVVIRVPDKKDVTGRLVVPKPDGSGLIALKFRLAANTANPTSARNFQFAKIEHYERRLRFSNVGAAWYRHQIGLANKALGFLSVDEAARMRQLSPQRNGDINGNRSDMDRTYDLFSGGRAVSENLQLDRELLFPRGGLEQRTSVRLDSIEGITVKEIDWQPLLKGAKPTLDVLASWIPADQHVVFFPTFAAAMNVADEAKRQGTSILRHSELASRDTHLVDRYEQQLGLSLSTLGRMLGPQLVSSVAITGGDPYFATGTDVAVLFEAKQPSVLAALLLAKVRLDSAKVPEAKPVEGTIDGIKYVGQRTPDRRVGSFIAEMDRVVVVTNSLAQLQRLAAVRAGKSATIASLPEYLFFRQRYQLGDASESALLFISDATIRRWCGPRWRIASSRRTRDAAVLTQLQATHFDALVTGKDLKLGAITSDLPTSQAADMQLTSEGVLSPSIGRPDFLTPISELTFDSVTIAERDAYQRWRDGYQRNWTVAFDPIALRIGTDEKRLSADLSIMPLIVHSEYNLMQQIASGVKLKADSGEPHDTIAHFIMALNFQSPPIQMANQFLAGILVGNQGARVGADRSLDPLGWLGESISFFADRDPYWEELLKLDAHERELKLRREGFRLPVGVRIEVKQPLKLALFLTSVRAFIQQSGPGLTRWETVTHREQSYVKVSSARRGAAGVEELDNVALYYSTVGDGLILTPNDDVMKRAIDRQLARDQIAPLAKNVGGANEADATSGWLGESAAANFEQVLPLFFLWYSEVADPRQAAQAQSWSNLPILNEWKRRYPDRDPVEIHARFWNTELVCPGGGRYVWNEQWRTMESPVFGHPGEPKLPEKFEAPLFPFAKANFGLTFELNGLRSRLELLREAK
ncbi:MAG: hypothetical protein ACKV2Q_02915 [Planctomycetaceae bacterium]